MRIKILAFARFREIMGPEMDLVVERQATVGDLLDALCLHHPLLRDELFGPGEEMRDYVLVMVNRKLVQLPEGLQAGLKDRDEVAVFPPVAGG